MFFKMPLRFRSGDYSSIIPISLKALTAKTPALTLWPCFDGSITLILPGCATMTLDYETLVHSKKVVRLQPTQRLDLQGGTSFQQQIAAIKPEQGSLWLVDMAQVEFIDSAGRLALVEALSMAQANGCRLLVCHLRPSIKLIFEITQLDQIFELVDSSDQSVAGMLSQAIPSIAA